MKTLTMQAVTKGLATIRAIIVFGIVLSLCGCMGMNSKFDCNVSSGGRCAPMHSIHKMVDQGMFHENGKDNLPGNNSLAKTNAPYGCPLASFEGRPIRSAETIQQIWIGPYEDANGNYHEPAYIYAVVKKGRWISEEQEVIQD